MTKRQMREFMDRNHLLTTEVSAYCMYSTIKATVDWSIKFTLLGLVMRFIWQFLMCWLVGEVMRA